MINLRNKFFPYESFFCVLKLFTCHTRFKICQLRERLNNNSCDIVHYYKICEIKSFTMNTYVLCLSNVEARFIQSTEIGAILSYCLFELLKFQYFFPGREVRYHLQHLRTDPEKFCSRRWFIKLMNKLAQSSENTGFDWQRWVLIFTLCVLPLFISED